MEVRMKGSRLVETQNRDGVEELKEDGGSIRSTMTLFKAMAKAYKVFFDKNFEPVQRSVKRIAMELDEATELRRAIPAVETMNKSVTFDLRGCLNQLLDVHEPIPRVKRSRDFVEVRTAQEGCR